MAHPKSFTYELLEGSRLLSLVRQELSAGGEGWQAVAECMPLGHVEYRPIRNNPMRSGYPFQYQSAGLNLTLYFPEKEFEFLLDHLDKDKVMELKSVVQSVIPERSGYIIHEFKRCNVSQAANIGQHVVRSARGGVQRGVH